MADATPDLQLSRPPLGPFTRLAAAVPFGVLSAARRARIFHPVGVAFEAVLTIEKAAPPIGRLDPGDHPAVVRLSRGFGLPEPWPDVLGIAIKLPDVDGYGGDQDLLLVTSGQRPVVRHLLLPARSFTGQTYSTVLLFQVGPERVLFGLEAVDVDRPHSLDELRATDDASDISFILTMAPPAAPWTAIGELRLGARIPDKAAEDLRFDPWNDAAGIRPVGPLNALRAAAYPGSQRGRQLTSRRGR